MKDLKVDAEAKLKESFRLALEHGIITEKSNEPVFNHVKSFLEKDYAYFVFEFQNAELNELRDITCQVADEWSTHKFGVYKKLLEKQLEYYHPDGKS